MKLLIAEDDPRLLKTLVHIFEGERYSVDGVPDGESAYDYAMSGEYDGFVFDIMMPGRDGIALLRAIREKGITAPALFLTARAEVSDRIDGLDAGADDYLPKPFSTGELLARVRAMLRRRDSFSPDIISAYGMTLNRGTYEIAYAGKSRKLSAREFQIAETMMASPGVIISADKFITHIWGWDASVDTSVIWVHISNFRKKTEEIGAPVRIRFVRGVGYLMEEAK